MHSPDNFLRAALAEQAARQILHGHSPCSLYSLLRRITTGELLTEAQIAPLCSRSLMLSPTLDALLCAVQLAVRRPPGWLRVDGLQTLPARFVIGARPALFQAALLCFFRDCLLGGKSAFIGYSVTPKAVLLRLICSGNGCGSETIALLSALARTCGGAVLFNIAGGFTAVLRLPVSPTLPHETVHVTTADELLHDRFSPLYLYLHELCADPWE